MNLRQDRILNFSCKKIYYYVQWQYRGEEMTEIVDFELLKKQRYIEKQCSLKQKSNIDMLVDEQALTIREHAALLNILKVLKDKRVEPKIVFQDVFELSKKDFERIYKLDWWTVAKHCIIFLKILKDNNEADYEQFFSK